MNETIKKILASILTLIVFTTALTGCSDSTSNSDSDSNSESMESSSTVSEVEILPGIQESSDGEFTVQFAYWYDNTIEETQNNFTPTNELYLNKIPIYEDSEGNKLLLSGRTPIYLKDGKIAPNDLFRNLRMAETGERIYADLDRPSSEIYTEFQEMLKKTSTEQKIDFRERVKEEQVLELVEGTTYQIYINNIPTGDAFTVDDRFIPIYSLINKLHLAWFRGDIETNTAVLRLYTGKGTVEIAISCNEDGVYEWKYPGVDEVGIVNPSEFQYTESNFNLSPRKIQTLLGYDIDVFDDYINIVTDTKDLVTESSWLGVENLFDLNDVMDVDLNKVDTTKPIK